MVKNKSPGPVIESQVLRHIAIPLDRLFLGQKITIGSDTYAIRDEQLVYVTKKINVASREEEEVFIGCSLSFHDVIELLLEYKDGYDQGQSHEVRKL